MGVFTFVCKESGADWSAKQLNGDLGASAGCAFDLQRMLVQAALSADSSGAVQSSFSYVTPSSAVFQVIIGGAVGGGAYIGTGAGAAAGPAASSGGGGSAAPAEEKKEEKEESDDDMGFSLFD